MRLSCVEKKIYELVLGETCLAAQLHGDQIVEAIDLDIEQAGAAEMLDDHDLGRHGIFRFSGDDRNRIRAHAELDLGSAGIVDVFAKRKNFPT